MLLRSPRHALRRLSATAAGVLLGIGVAAAAPNGEAAFLAENETAMAQMMHGMQVAPTGDVDRDFATAMIPHHQGAMDMAEAELRHGHNEQLRRIAQGIIVEQQQEIVAMRLALDSAGDVKPKDVKNGVVK